MMGKIMKRNDFGKIVNYTMKGNNKSKLLAIEGVRSDSKQHIAESFSCQAGLNTRIRTPVYHISLSFSKQDSGKLTDDPQTGAASTLPLVTHHTSVLQHRLHHQN